MAVSKWIALEDHGSSNDKNSGEEWEEGDGKGSTLDGTG